MISLGIRAFLAAMILALGFTNWAFAQSTDASMSDLPHWIWSHRVRTANLPDATPSTLSFSKSICISETVREAKLKIAADFCHARVMINEYMVLDLAPYSDVVELDVAPELFSEVNEIKIFTDSIDGPSAVAVSLWIRTGNNRHGETLKTDGTWFVTRDFFEPTNDDVSFDEFYKDSLSFTEERAAELGVVAPALWNLGRRPVTVDAGENYEQWQLALHDSKFAIDTSFWAAPGFQVEKIHTAAPDEGSWVSMAFDPQGRLTIAREERGLLRMTLRNRDETIDVEKVQVVNDELLECRGLLYAHQSLYANANNSRGLYRLRDTNGDDHFDEVKLLREFPGGVGHGRNDLALGPDGWIYSIHGDSVELPTVNVKDRTSPYRDGVFGTVHGQGYLIRTDPEGINWEVVCTGLRNPFGLAVNPHGDWFTYDADAEFDMGTPWYRPTRVVQMFSGADFGWRAITGKWPPYFPDHADNAMPTLDIGKGSPTAVLFPNESNFPEEIRRSLIIADWTYGRLLAVSLFPRGAGYRASAQTFVQGRPFNVTDLAIGPDRCLYAITGGRKTQSALYRIRFLGKQRDRSVTSLHEQQCETHAKTARAIRQKLEAMHADPLSFDLAFVCKQLNAPDWNIRNAARIALEHQPVEIWRSKVLEDQNSGLGYWEGRMALARVESSPDWERYTEFSERGSSFESSLLGPQLMTDLYGLLIQQPRLTHEDRTKMTDRFLLYLISQLEGLNEIPASDRPLGVTRRGTGFQHELFGLYLLTLLPTPTDDELRRKFELLARMQFIPDDHVTQEHKIMRLMTYKNLWEWDDDKARLFLEEWKASQDFIAGEGMPGFLNQIREEFLSRLPQEEREVWRSKFDTPIFEDDSSTIAHASRPIVKKWSLDDFREELTLAPPLEDDLSEDAVPETNRGRLSSSTREQAFDIGERVFQQALCVKCHRFQDRGSAVGPDLTNVRLRFTKLDILQSILEPSLVVSDTYQATKVLTADGQSYVGKVITKGDFRSQKLLIQTDPLRPAQLQEIDKREIESIKPSETSPMPSGLLDSFTKEEIHDLLSYLVD